MTHLKSREGFSLIELLVAVVIIGILAGLVVSKTGDLRERSYISAMKNSIQKAMVSEEQYLDANNAYGDITALQAAGFQADDDVTLTITPTLPATYGFWAIATHTKTSAQCGIEYGSSGPAGTEWPGKIACDPAGPPAGIDGL